MNKNVPLRVSKRTMDPECWLKLFQPDILAPVGFYERNLRTRQPDPEKMLMFAVLEDAISSYHKGRSATDAREKACYREAKDWLLYEQSDWPFSFDKICEALDLDPSYLRKGLSRRRGSVMNQLLKTRVFHIVRAGRRVRKKYRLRSCKNAKFIGRGDNPLLARDSGG